MTWLKDSLPNECLSCSRTRQLDSLIIAACLCWAITNKLSSAALCVFVWFNLLPYQTALVNKKNGHRPLWFSRVYFMTGLNCSSRNYEKVISLVSVSLPSHTSTQANSLLLDCSAMLATATGWKMSLSLSGTDSRFSFSFLILCISSALASQMIIDSMRFTKLLYFHQLTRTQSKWYKHLNCVFAFTFILHASAFGLSVFSLLVCEVKICLLNRYMCFSFAE